MEKENINISFSIFLEKITGWKDIKKLNKITILGNITDGFNSDSCYEYFIQ